MSEFPTQEDIEAVTGEGAAWKPEPDPVAASVESLTKTAYAEYAPDLVEVSRDDLRRVLEALKARSDYEDLRAKLADAQSRLSDAGWALDAARQEAYESRGKETW